jgi:hypothetical protein
MRMIGGVLLILLGLLAGCDLSRKVIPDSSIPHRVSEETTVKVWVRGPDGKLSQVEVRLLAGWWIASDRIVEGK